MLCRRKWLFYFRRCIIRCLVRKDVRTQHQLSIYQHQQVLQNDKIAPQASRTFDSYSSAYQYFKVGYGVTKAFTLSLEGGYYFKKKEIGLDGNPLSTYESSGFGDLIVFPQYNIYNKTKGNLRHEVTVGMGLKIPIGGYDNTIGNVEPFWGMSIM